MPSCENLKPTKVQVAEASAAETLNQSWWADQSVVTRQQRQLQVEQKAKGLPCAHHDAALAPCHCDGDSDSDLVHSRHDSSDFPQAGRLWLGRLLCRRLCEWAGIRSLHCPLGPSEPGNVRPLDTCLEPHIRAPDQPQTFIVVV
jgi:hypothetical protein